MAPRFSPAALRFLRALTRNNDREWFRARRDEYERELRAPMIALVEQLAADFKRFAPELVASPKHSLYRIYRDTRFSEDKSPLKTHVAAVFPWRGLPKHQGAGLYLEVAPQWVWVGGGMYAPETAHLARVREHIADTWPEVRDIVTARRFRTRIGRLEGDRLTRIPRGYPGDHPAADFLRYRQFLAGREFPASLATSAEFYPTLTRTFKAVVPLVRFLNEPLTASRS